MSKAREVIALLVRLFYREPALCSALAVAVLGSGSSLLTVGTTQHGIFLAVLNAIVALAGGAVTRRSVYSTFGAYKLVQHAQRAALVANVRVKSGSSK